MAGVHRWQFTPEELQNTPSRKAGIDADKELNYRQQCANLIQDMGQRLNVTQLCISTAIVYMHRFYVFHSFTRFHRNPMASTCLFLAAKVEEQPRKLEHVITWYHMCVNRDQGPLDVKSENYLEMAQELVSNENILLQTLGFDISVEHPHQNVVKTCTLVKASKDLAQTSYILATNSLHLTTMCLHIRHTVVACVCIHLACKWSNYQIPCSSEGKQWFEYVDKDTTIAELEVLTNDFLTILDNCPSKLKKKILTWKSGNNKTDLSDEMANALSKSEEQSNPTERRRMPPASAAAGSAAAAAQKDFQRSSAGHPSHAGGSGLRRVQTEPAIAQIEQKRSKKPSHPPPTHGHHRDIPGYHGKPPPQQQHSIPSHHKHPYSSGTAGKPTHPPPSSKSRHSGHPPHLPASGSSASHHQPDAARANIFEQMQIEQGGQPTTTAGGVGVGPLAPEGQGGGVSRKSLLSQQHPQHRVHGSHHQKTPHGPNQRLPHSAVSPAVLATSSSQKRNHTEETRNRDSLAAGPGGEPVGLSSKEHSLKTLAAARQQDKQGKQAWRLEEGEICSAPSGLVPPVSVSVQERQEREMQEKLQNEMRKQKERSQKLEKERKERQLQKALKSPSNLKSPGELKSPQLTSPPIGGGDGTGRSKNDSTSSKSDSDTGSKHTPTKEERLRLLKEHQNQVMQDDRKRLRRMSEELGDPKIEKKTVVMLDNYFTSPEVHGSSSQETSPKGGVGKMDKNHAAGLQSSGGEKGNVPTPSRTISLEKYRERKPPAAPQATPTGGQSSSSDYQLINPDKPSLAMEHLASIKLQGLKPLSEILKSSDMVKKEEEDLMATNNPTVTAVRIKLEAPSPKKVKSEKLQRKDSSGRLAAAGKSAHHGLGVNASSDPSTKHTADQMFMAKSDIKLEFDPTTKVQHRSTSQQKVLLSREPSAETLQHRSSGSKDHPLTTSSSSSVSVVKQEVFDSPKREKNIPSLKIKLGGKPVVTMSPGTSEKKELSANEPVIVTKKEHHHHGHKEHGHRHHEKKPHKHKHRERSKHRGEAAGAVVVPTATPTSLQASSGKSDSETMSGEKLKLKFNLKQLGMSGSESGAAISSESPFKIDNPNRSLTGTPELVDAGGVSATTPGASQAGGTPGSGGGSSNSSGSAAVKLVLQKDRSGQYSSGQKAKHSTNNSSSRHHSDKSSRKRVHSPADQQRRGSSGVIVSEASTPVVPVKIPRSDSSASLGAYELNGSRSNSPSQMELMQQQARKVEKLIEKQKKNIKKTLEQQGTGNTPTGLTNSPRVHPQAYPP